MLRAWKWFDWVGCVVLPSLVFGTNATGPSSNPPPDLQNRVDELEWQLRQLQQQVFAQQSITSTAFPMAAPAVPACNECGQQACICNACQSGAAVTKKKFPTVNLHGFFQADAILVHQSPGNVATVGDAQDGAEFRRARLSASGDAWNNVGYLLEMDFAFPGHPSFMDVWAELRDVPILGNIRGGQWRQPVGMDPLTSVKELTFLERALPFAFVPFRQIGAGFYDYSEDELATWAGSVFRYPTNLFGSGVGDNGGYGTAWRGTFLPWVDEDSETLVHVGGSFAFADPANDLIRFRNQPEVYVGDFPATSIPPGVQENFPAFVDTGQIPASNYNVAGLELAGAMGPLQGSIWSGCAPR